MTNSFPNETDFIDLNVAILPDEKLSLKLIQWSKIVASRIKTDYILDTGNHLPHLSLYSARYPIRNKKSVEEVVINITKSLNSFNISLKGFSSFSGYFFYDAKKRNELIQLHEKIVDELNPLREGLISDNQKQLKGLSADQEIAIQKYGYVSVKKLYMPHVSITHITDLTQGNLIKNILPNESDSFSVKTLAISYFAEYGTFPKPSKIYSVPV